MGNSISDKSAEERLELARQALQALDNAHFVATEHGYGQAERDNYQAYYWKQLREALGVEIKDGNYCRASQSSE